MTDAHWAPDPTGRHETRLWDGQRWSDQVADGGFARLDSGPLPLFAPAPATPAGLPLPARVRPAGLAADPDDAASPRAGRHVLLGLLTAGLWWVFAPAVHWIRRRSWLTAVAWVTAWACVAGAGIVLLRLGAPPEQASPARTVEAFPALIPSSGAPQGTDGPTPAAASPTATSASPTVTASATSPSATGDDRAARTPATSRPAGRAVPAASPTKAVRPPATSAQPRPRATRPRPSPSVSVPPVVVPGLDPRFPSCPAAKAHGYGPYYAGVDPEYLWYPDKDGDGVACERERERPQR
ncbi:MAG: excalibur calcium-binding domain-containing protein [Kineosporiaceae bacterium]